MVISEKNHSGCINCYYATRLKSGYIWCRKKKFDTVNLSCFKRKENQNGV